MWEARCKGRDLQWPARGNILSHRGDTSGGNSGTPLLYGGRNYVFSVHISGNRAVTPPMNNATLISPAILQAVVVAINETFIPKSGVFDRLVRVMSGESGEGQSELPSSSLHLGQTTLPQIPTHPKRPLTVGIKTLIDGRSPIRLNMRSSAETDRIAIDTVVDNSAPIEINM